LCLFFAVQDTFKSGDKQEIRTSVISQASLSTNIKYEVQDDLLSDDQKVTVLAFLDANYAVFKVHGKNGFIEVNN